MGTLYAKMPQDAREIQVFSQKPRGAVRGIRHIRQAIAAHLGADGICQCNFRAGGDNRTVSDTLVLEHDRQIDPFTDSHFYHEHIVGPPRFLVAGIIG